MWLLLVAALGMLLPNGLFVSWLLNDFTSLSAALSDRLAAPGGGRSEPSAREGLLGSLLEPVVAGRRGQGAR